MADFLDETGDKITVRREYDAVCVIVEDTAGADEDCAAGLFTPATARAIAAALIKAADEADGK